MRIEDFLSNDAFVMVNKKLSKELGICKAVYLQELISQRKRFGVDKFYFTQDNMCNELGISAKTQQRYAKELQEKGLINIEKKGIPARNWYTINDAVIINTIFSSVKLTAPAPADGPDYYNKKESNKENINSESSQSPKPENITPLTSRDLTFEEIYNLFYHKSGRKSSEDKCKKVFESLHLDKEGYEMLVRDLKLFRIEYKYGIKDQQYRPKFETYVGGFNAEGVNEEYRLKMIIRYHMENADDIEKGKKRYKDLCDTFGKELVDKLVKQYGKNKNKITLKAD